MGNVFFQEETTAEKEEPQEYGSEFKEELTRLQIREPTVEDDHEEGKTNCHYLSQQVAERIMENTDEKYPVIFVWKHGGPDVYVAYSGDNWSHKYRMHRSDDDTDFKLIMKLPPGHYHYRFVIDNKWRCAPDQRHVRDANGAYGNVLQVQSAPYQTTCTDCNNYMVRNVSNIGGYRLGVTLPSDEWSTRITVAINESTNKRFIMKIVNKQKMKRMGMEKIQEWGMEVLSLLNHPYIRKLYKIIHTPLDTCFVLEYVCGGELFDLIVDKGRFVESEARRYFQQIICAVQYCHYKKIVHRDLKPENILIDDNGDIRIEGFENSNKTKHSTFMLKTSVGTPNYAAPEVIWGEEYIGQLADIWSIGVILYAMLCGCLPFDDVSVTNLFRKIETGIYKIPKYVSTDAADLIKRMLVVDPANRITMNEIKQHCWFKKNLTKYWSGEYYEYNDGNDLILGNGNYIELRQQHNSNTFYLPKGITNLIYRMMDPMFGLK
eukprot:186330_1